MKCEASFESRDCAPDMLLLLVVRGILHLQKNYTLLAKANGATKLCSVCGVNSPQSRPTYFRSLREIPTQRHTYISDKLFVFNLIVELIIEKSLARCNRTAALDLEIHAVTSIDACSSPDSVAMIHP